MILARATVKIIGGISLAMLAFFLMIAIKGVMG
jgi:hypothetical protein